MLKAKRSVEGGSMISVKEIMREFSISYQTVNHYTDFGLLSVALKRGNARFYNRNSIRTRMKRIRKLVAEGYSLRLIRKKLLGV